MILLLYVKQLYCLKEQHSIILNVPYLDSWNFSKGEEILFIKHMRICVIVTEINVQSLFYKGFFIKGGSMLKCNKTICV